MDCGHVDFIAPRGVGNRALWHIGPVGERFTKGVFGVGEPGQDLLDGQARQTLGARVLSLFLQAARYAAPDVLEPRRLPHEHLRVRSW